MNILKKLPKSGGRLPYTPSKLIRLALKDLKAVERDKKHYVVEMGYWHFNPDPEFEEDKGLEATKCYVCLAGSVMAKTLKTKPKFDRDPFDFEDSDGRALKALDYLREGKLYSAFDILGFVLPYNVKQKVRVSKYKTNPKKFKKQMAELADALEKIGY